MKRVYVAGAYSGPDVLTIFGNMRRGLALSMEVLEAGMAPFSPWLDYQFSLLGDVSLDQYYEYSLAWLEAADAVLVVQENLGGSKGTQAEIMRAFQLGIPVFYHINNLIAWRIIEDEGQRRAGEFHHGGGAGHGNGQTSA